MKNTIVKIKNLTFIEIDVMKVPINLGIHINHHFCIIR